MEMDIKELSETDLQSYAPIFSCIFNLFGDYVGVYFKLVIDGKERLLQRRDNMFVLYNMAGENLVNYEMFTVDDEYKIDSAGFDNFEVYTMNGDKVIKENGSSNLESLVFIKRSDGRDSDGFDGTVGYIQYNQEKDTRLMLLYQQMYNDRGKVYSYHVDKNPIQIMIEKGVGAKQRGSILPVRTSRYYRCDYDYRDHNVFYNLAVLKDYGLQEFMEKGAYALHRENVISRYQKIITTTSSGYAVTGFPFCKQYPYEAFNELFDEYGFRKKIPDSLLSIYNGEFDDLNYYQEIASFMKEIEMSPPEEVIKLNLRYEGNGNDGTNS